MGLRILADWGSSNLRLWLVDGRHVLDKVSGPGAATRGLSFAEALSALIAPWLKETVEEPILLCGMVGARTGWVEAPYVCCPARRRDWSQSGVTAALGERTTRIAPGLKGVNFAGDPDVMRGEETQIFGAQALKPDLLRGETLVVLPGTHSKWVLLRDGVICNFHTIMTGELFAVLADHSALLTVPGEDTDVEAGFSDGLAAAIRQPVNTALFAARSRQLLEGRTRGWARSYLSGLLIGGELHAMQSISTAKTITLIGAGVLNALYARAAAELGIGCETLDGEACSVAGLLAFAEDDA